jgi:hypothetical protein
MYTKIAMPPHWPKDTRLKIKAALAACAPECILSPQVVDELRLSTGLTASQIKRSAENFRTRVRFEKRGYVLESDAALQGQSDSELHGGQHSQSDLNGQNRALLDGDNDYVFKTLSREDSHNIYATRHSNEVLLHIVNAFERAGNCHMGRFTESAVQMLMQTTHLSAHSIRRWVSRHRRRPGYMRLANPKLPRKERRRMCNEAKKREQAADAAEDIRVSEEMRAIKNA